MRKKIMVLLALGLTLLCFGGLTAWAAPGDVDAGFLNGATGGNNPIRALAVQPDGKILISGDFITINEVRRNSIARLNADGSLDTSFMSGLAGASAPVRAIALQPDGKIIIAGDFSTVNGVPRLRIARLNQDGSLDSFGNGQAGSNGQVSAVAVQADGKIIIGGAFSTVNGFASGGIARLNADGTFDEGFGGSTNMSVFGIALQADGKIVIGGQFTTVNGTARNNIARLNADGTLDTGFLNGQNGADNPIVSLALQGDGKIVMGGGFTNVNGAARARIARLNADGTLDTAFGNGLAGANNSVLSIALQANGKAVIGGQFNTLNTVARGGIARLNSDGTLDTTFGNGLAGGNTGVRAVSLLGDGRLLISGDFITVNGVTRNRIARLNANGTLDTAFLNGLSGANDNVFALAAQADGKVVIGGTFTQVNGVARNNIARLNSDGTLDTGFLNGQSGASGSVGALAVQADGKILIGGGFTTVNGEARNGIARLNANGTLDAGFGNGQSGTDVGVVALAVQTDGKIVIGGSFFTVNGEARNGIARLNADGTLDTVFGNGQSGASGAVAALAVQADGKTVIGGLFNTVNGLNRRNIARLNADGSLDTGFLNGQVGANNTILALALQTDGKIVIGGEFTTVNTVARNRIARLNADGTLDTAFGNGLNGTNNIVFVLVAQTDGKIVIGGSFVTVNGVTRNRIARLNADGTLDTGFGNGQSGADSEARALAVQPDGKVLIGGIFTTVNGVARNRIARLLNSFGISGRLSDSNGASLSGVPVSLTGAVSGTTLTDANGIYDFPTLVTGGNYTVIPNSPAYAFTPARMDFTNLTADQAQNFVAPANSVPPDLPPLTDNFPPRPNPDPMLWNLGILTQPPGSFDPLVTVSQQTGQLVITPRANQTGPRFNGYVSVNNLDLSNGQASVELAQAGTGGAQSLFSVGTDFNNFSRFMVMSPLPNQPLIIEQVINGVKQAPLEGNMPMLMLQIVFNGQVFLNVAIPYDPVAHRFLRFRHLARDANNNPANLLVFETSPDASVYTERARGDLGERSVAAITVELAGGTAGLAGNPGPVIFDNLVTQVVNARFALAAVTVSEGAGSVTLNVTRTGLTNLAGAMEYSTQDGTATQRTRYVAASGVLSFATGETTKSLQILLLDNALVDGSQDFNVFLGPGQGLGVNGPGRTIVTITDNDVPPITTNPLETPSFFVTQQYYDFLSRPPDAAGLAFWVGQIIDPCGGNAACISQRRWNVSNAFFFELEFQQTGSYVYRLYRAAYGNTQPFPNSQGDMDTHPFCMANPANCQLIRAAHIPNYAKFINDRARLDAGNLAATQLSLTNAFVNRAEFRQRYPVTQTAAQFVDTLISNIQTASGANLTSQRDALIALHNASGRGAVLYRLADDNTLGNPINNRAFIDAEYSRSFVLTQYFGYLRRDPDMPGLNFWLGIINRFPLRAPTGQNAMVCAFITSGEYQTRFSLITPRTDAECPTPP